MLILKSQKAPIWQKKKKESKRKDGKTEKITSTDSTYDKELEKSRLPDDICNFVHIFKIIM